MRASYRARKRRAREVNDVGGRCQTVTAVLDAIPSERAITGTDVGESLAVVAALEIVPIPGVTIDAVEEAVPA
jgi:hypothetical protein